MLGRLRGKPARAGRRRLSATRTSPSPSTTSSSTRPARPTPPSRRRSKPATTPRRRRDNITEAKNTLEEARQHLQDARESLETVDGLDVDPSVKEYASLLSEAMDDQLAAEAKEMEFYGILEEDPALENNREEGPGPALRSRRRLPEGRRNLRRGPEPGRLAPRADRSKLSTLQAFGLRVLASQHFS